MAIAPTNDFSTVTELPNDQVTQEQIDRVAHRYMWAARYCQHKEVLEVACGCGVGLGQLAKVAKRLDAGDITPALVDRARMHYGQRISIEIMDAMALPYEANSLDVIVLFEAIYYLPSAEEFVRQCRRLLRTGGLILIVTANKDLYDFNPSPLSHRYYGVVELGELFEKNGFTCEFFGNSPIAKISWRQRILRPLKKLVVRLDVMPKTMAGKKILKRLVFGSLAPMPAEIGAVTTPFEEPTRLPSGKPDNSFKVIYLAASLVE